MLAVICLQLGAKACPTRQRGGAPAAFLIVLLMVSAGDIPPELKKNQVAPFSRSPSPSTAFCGTKSGEVDVARIAPLVVPEGRSLWRV